MNKLDYIINLLLKDNNVAVSINKLQGNFGRLEDSISDVSTTAARAATTVQRSMSNINLKAIIDNVREVSDGLAKLLNTDIGTGYEQSMADLSSITGIVGADLKELGKVARQTGIESGLGAKGGADAFALLASQIEVSKIGMDGLMTLQKETITLAHAGGMTMTDAATAMAATINQFGLQAGEANRVINVLAAGSKYGASEVNDLAQSFKVAGSVASQAGLSVEQTAGALEILSKSNIKGAEAGTVLRNIIIKLQTVLGIDLSKHGLSASLEALKPKLNDINFLTKTFRSENLAAAQFLIANASAVDEMTAAVTGTNVAQEQAAIRTDTTVEKMKRMQAAADDARIGFFELTGGYSAYIETVGTTAVMVAQLIPLFNVLKSGIVLLAAADTRATIASVAHKTAMVVSAAASKALAIATMALNAIMSANPIALVVLALGALVAGAVAAYNTFEPFKQVVDAVWLSVKALAVQLWDKLVAAFVAVKGAIVSLWDTISRLLGIEREMPDASDKAAKGVDKVAGSATSGAAALDLFTDAADKQNKQLNFNIETLGGVSAAIDALKKQQAEASVDVAIGLEKEIRLLNKKREAIENLIMIGAADPQANVALIAGAPSKIDTTAADALTSIDTSGLRGQVDQTINHFSELSKMKMTGLQDQLSGVSSIMGSMSDVLGQTAGAWLQWGSNVVQAIATALPQLLAFATEQSAVAVATTANNTAVAATGAAASTSAIPVVGPVLAIAAVASILAALASVPKARKFATGGIVYGNTFAQVGEYAGASNNPEVIAPLSDLTRLIQPSNPLQGMTLDARVRMDELYISLQRIANKKTRVR